MGQGMRNLFFLILTAPALAAASGNLSASRTAGTLCGQVVDRASLKPVEEVAVHVEGTALTLTTDEQGKFSASGLQPGRYNLCARRIGYKAITVRDVNVVAGSQTDLLLCMEPGPVELPAVSVTAARSGVDMERYDEGLRLIIDPSRQSHQPGAFGDLLRSLRRLPAFGMTGDFDGLLYSRGGSPDQNLVLLDQTSIPYPYRLRLLMGGGVSAFMPELLSYVEIMPGGFPARYGNRTSAVLHLHTREGNYAQRSLSCRIDLLAASTVFDQPLLAGRGSLLLAGRRSMADLIGPALVRGPYVFPHFDDLYAKLALTPGLDHKVGLTVAHSREGARLAALESEEMTLSQDSRSETVALDWSATLNRKLLVGASWCYSADRNWLQFLDAADKAYGAHLRYETSEHSANGWLYLLLGRLSRIEAGATLISSRSTLAWEGTWRTPLLVPSAIHSHLDVTLVGGYIQNHLHLAERLDMMLGMRADYGTLSGEYLFSPRLNVAWRPGAGLKTFAAYGHFYQYPTFLSTIARNEPLLITDEAPLRSEKATHIILGAEREFAGVLVANLTAYFKSYQRMLLPQDYVQFTAANCGEGYSTGVEFSLDTPQQLSSSLAAHAHYAWAQSRYRRVGSQGWTPFKWERPHSFAASVEAKLLPQLRAGIGWSWASGRPHLLNGTWATGNGRLPPYRRLDMRLSYSIRMPVRKEVCLYLDVFNVANERNVYDTTWDFHFPGQAPQGATTIYMMPRMFSVGGSIKL